GKVKLGKNRVVTGVAARIAGGVFLLPIPVAFGIGMIVGFMQASEGKARDSSDLKLTLTLVELGVCIFCALLGFGIALAAAGPSEQGETGRKLIDERELPTPATAAEEPIQVFPMEDPPEAIRREPLPSRRSTHGPLPVVRAIPVNRPQP